MPGSRQGARQSELAARARVRDPRQRHASAPVDLGPRAGRKGNDPPLRVIEGPKTQLNWPTGIAFDPERRELFVANDMGPSILVFDANASGDVAPKRVLKGRKTKLANPTGVALDLEERRAVGREFRRPLGDRVPDRRAGRHGAAAHHPERAESAPSLMIGNPGALTYDSKREEILVPN